MDQSTLLMQANVSGSVVFLGDNMAFTSIQTAITQRQQICTVSTVKKIPQDERQHTWCKLRPRVLVVL